MRIPKRLFVAIPMLFVMCAVIDAADPRTHGGSAGATDFQDRNGGLGTGYDRSENTEARGFGYIQPIDPNATMGCYGTANDWTNFRWGFQQSVVWDVHLEADMYCDAAVHSFSQNSKLALSRVALDSWGDVDSFVVNSSIVCHPLLVANYLRQVYVRGNGTPEPYLSNPMPLGHSIFAPWQNIAQKKEISIRLNKQLTQSTLNFTYWSFGEILLQASFDESRVEASFRNIAVSPRTDANWKGSYVEATDINGRFLGNWNLK